LRVPFHVADACAEGHLFRPFDFGHAEETPEDQVILKFEAIFDRSPEVFRKCNVVDELFRTEGRDFIGVDFYFF